MENSPFSHGDMLENEMREFSELNSEINSPNCSFRVQTEDECELGIENGGNYERDLLAENVNENYMADQTLNEQDHQENLEEEMTTKSKQNALDILRYETKQIICIKANEEATIQSIGEEIQRKHLERLELQNKIREQMQVNKNYETALMADKLHINQACKQLLATKEIVGSVNEFVQSQSTLLNNSQVIPLHKNILQLSSNILEMKKKYEGQINDKKQQIEEILNKACAFVPSGIKEIESGNSKLKEQISKLNIQLDESKTNYNENKEKVEKLKESLDVVLKQKQEKSAELLKLSHHLDELKILHKKEQQLHSEGYEEVKKNQEVVKNGYEDAKRKLQETEDIISNTMQLITNKESALDQLKVKHQSVKDDFAARVKQFEANNLERKIKIEDLKIILNEKSQHLVKLQKEIESVNDANQKLKSEIDTFKNKLLTCQENKMAQMSKNSELHPLIKNEEMSLITEQNRKSLLIEKLNHAKAIKQEILNSLEQKKAQAATELKRLLEELESKQCAFEDEQKRYENILEDNEKKIAFQNAALNYMNQKSEDQGTLVKNEKFKLDLKKAEVDGLKKAIHETNNKIQHLKGKHAEAKKANNEITESQTTNEESTSSQIPAEIVVVEENQTERPASILKSPKRSPTPVKKVSFHGIPSFESTTDGSGTASPVMSKSFEELLQEMEKERAGIKQMTPVSKKRKFSP